MFGELFEGPFGEPWRSFMLVGIIEDFGCQCSGINFTEYRMVVYVLTVSPLERASEHEFKGLKVTFLLVPKV